MKRFLMVIVPALLMLATVGAFAQDDGDSTVLVAEDPVLGPILTDAEGMTLYLFTNDTTEGESTCYDDCAVNWPPFNPEGDLTLPEGVDGELTRIDRTDGTQMVAYNGIPLYYWINDVNPGDTTGQGVGDVWYVVAPGQQFGDPPVMGSAEATPEASPMASPVAGAAVIAVAEDPELGPILTDAEGMTLYLFTNDTTEGESTCYDDCAVNWPPFDPEGDLTLPEDIPGELTRIERTDGTTMVAYNGIPLYYWINDEAPGDTTGQGVGDVWYVVAPGQEFGDPATPEA